MRNLRLSTLLVAANVGLLLLAVVGLATIASSLLQRLADEQALARVEQAARITQRRIDDAGTQLHTSAALLAERPTLRRLLDQGDSAALQSFLEQFQQTSQLHAASVWQERDLLLATGMAVPWTELWDDQSAARGTNLVHPAPGEAPLLGAWADIVALPGHRVGVLIRLDERFTRELSREVGLDIRIGRATGTSGPTVSTARQDDKGVYIATAPLLDTLGAAVGMVEARLPTAEVNRSLQRLRETLIGLTVVVAGIAGAVSLVLGNRIARPLRHLTLAAARIGRGDLQTPVARPPGVEIGTLAAALEEMRRRLRSLTDDLQRERAEAQAIVTGIVEGVFSVDRERRIQYLNPQAAALLGTTPEVAIGRFCGDVLHPLETNGKRPCATNCPIVHARFRGGASATEHLRLSSGQRRTVVITSAPASDGMQMQVLRDETETEATRRLRDNVLANISHEFRTPLSAQLASIELLLDQLPELNTDQIANLVVAQQRGTLRLTQLIDNLLESARIEAGQDTIRRQPVALDAVVEEAVELLRPLIEQRHQQVDLDLPYPLPMIAGDARRLTQVFVNLLANAHKFAPAGSTIQIGGAVEKESISLWVEDEGPGLPAYAGQDIFSRFVRSSQEEPEQSGVGIGLWLVKSIVERHGGTVEAQNRPLGTRMTIRLPKMELASEDIDRRRR